MAVNRPAYWFDNINGAAEPFITLGLFQAGGTQAVKVGEILDNNTGNQVPLASDKAMAAIIAVANEEVKNGDHAGYYEIAIPRPGDRFRFELATAGNDAVGTEVGYSTSQKVATSPSNAIGNIAGYDNYPRQLHGSVGGTDQGTTLRTISYVTMTFVAAVSQYAALQT